MPILSKPKVFVGNSDKREFCMGPGIMVTQKVTERHDAGEGDDDLEYLYTTLSLSLSLRVCTSYLYSTGVAQRAESPLSFVISSNTL
jgi:hypothetical protein